jgi:hypothetical protein
MQVMGSVMKGKKWNNQKEDFPCVSSRFALFLSYIIIIVNQTVKLKFMALKQEIAQKIYKHI